MACFLWGLALSLGIAPWRFPKVATRISSLFLFVTESCSAVWMHRREPFWYPCISALRTVYVVREHAAQSSKSPHGSRPCPPLHR